MHKYYFLFIILIFVSCSCNENARVKTNKINIDASPVRLEPVGQNKKDTVFINFPLGTLLKYGRIGMSVPEWNKNLALLTEKGLINELKELKISDYDNYLDRQGMYAGTIYEGNISISVGKNRYDVSIRGLFVFPHLQNDTTFVYLRNNQQINDGLLIGIKIKLNNVYMRQFQEISQLHELQTGNMKFLAGDKLPKFELPKLDQDEFGNFLRSISAHRTQPTWQHEDDFSNEMKYKCLYEFDDCFSGYTISIEEKGVEVCDVVTLHKGSDVTQVDKPIKLKNYTWRYTYLEQAIYSKKFSGLKIEDYMSEFEKNEREKNKKSKSETENLIKEALK